MSEQVRGAQDLPDEFDLWREEDGKLILPRGFAHRLETLCSGIEIEWDSAMTVLPPSEQLFRDWRPLELRDYQLPARDAMIDWAQGLVQMPTGGGKSAVALEAIRWAGQRTLVIVGKTALARQWEAMALDHYGYKAGIIGEGEWQEEDLTIALWQTLWARREEIPEDFWTSYGAVVGDEIHHAAAMGLADLMSRFPAFYRWGLSATPEWDPLLFPIVQAVVGPVIHRTTDEEIGDKLIHPSVRIVETDFDFRYIDTHFLGRKRVGNNYSAMMSELCTDHDRNDLIAGIAREEAQAGHHVLIVTRRIEHVKQLVSRLEKTLRVGSRLHALTGAQTGADAQRILRAIENAEGGTVLISTVADEALDMPPLDRLIMAFPLRRIPLVKQQAGRVMRPSPGKEDAIIYDIVDKKIGVLASQQRDRIQSFRKRGWKIHREQEPEQATV